MKIVSFIIYTFMSVSKKDYYDGFGSKDL